MNLEQLKKEFIELKKEQLKYITEITSLSKEKIFTEQEKLEIYRKIKKDEEKLNELLKQIYKILLKSKTKIKHSDIIIEFNVNDYSNSLNVDDWYEKEYILKSLNIKNNKCIFTFKALLDIYQNRFSSINPDIIENGQALKNKSIYVFCGYYPDYFYDLCVGVYKMIFQDRKEEVKENKIEEFEKDKIIIRTQDYINSYDVETIFEEQLLDPKNNTIDDCINSTKKIIEEQNYLRSPEYKEKVLLNKINELYKRIKGRFINEEILFSGKFLSVLKESYILPNNKCIEKEKVIKNNGKSSVIIIAITQDDKYIISFQNRLKDKIIAEFPSGYIEKDEDILTAAQRELMEETGYISENLFIVDEAYTSSGIDNSTSYIVIANNCIKKTDISHSENEFLEYGLFSKQELEYLINNNIMNGAMNKLAYYNLICNVGNNKRLKKIN